MVAGLFKVLSMKHESREQGAEPLRFAGGNAASPLPLAAVRGSRPCERAACTEKPCWSQHLDCAKSRPHKRIIKGVSHPHSQLLGKSLRFVCWNLFLFCCFLEARELTVEGNLSALN